MSDKITTALESAERLLKSHPDYRVLKRLPVHEGYGPPVLPGLSLKTGIVLDTETTGLDSTDRVLELGMLKFEFDPQTGNIYKILDSFSEYEDPGVPIAPSATAVHGITAAMVRGKKFDDDAVRRVTQGVDIVIAHNARFDRPMIEKRYPLFAKLRWSCTYQEIDWKGQGFGGSSLEFIAYKYGFFYEAHGAVMDCRALLEVLHQSESERYPYLKQLIVASERIEERIWALNAPFDKKDLMKGRGYRWSNDEPKAWWISLARPDAYEERRWLLKNVYAAKSARVRVDVIDATSRYSLRLTDSKVRQISLDERDQD